MRKRGLKVTQATYTGLINACATCRDSKQGLIRLNQLRNKMREQQYEMNEANYNALIKSESASLFTLYLFILETFYSTIRTNKHSSETLIYLTDLISRTPATSINEYRLHIDT
jgi:hypothetical protein